MSHIPKLNDSVLMSHSQSDSDVVYDMPCPEARLPCGKIFYPLLPFLHEDNFRLLRKMGAELVHFSPIRDKKLPVGLDGLLLYGGYPELNGKELEKNTSMREEIQKALSGGMPCMAECGGFMYLHGPESRRSPLHFCRKQASRQLM